jgi:hypothetical protein
MLLLSLIESTAKTLKEIQKHSNDQVTADLFMLCGELLKRSCELEQSVLSHMAVLSQTIVHTSKHYKHKGDGDPPGQARIDPSLFKWVTHCRICLLGLQAQVERDARSLQQHSEKQEAEASLIDEGWDVVERFDDQSTLAEEVDGLSLETTHPLRETLSMDESTFPDLEVYRNQLEEFVQRLEKSLPFQKRSVRVPMQRLRGNDH